MAFYIPDIFGSKPIGTFNFTDLLPQTKLTPVNGVDDRLYQQYYNWEATETPTDLVQAKANANTNGKLNWQKVLNAVLIYGPVAIGLLQQTGVIKDRRSLANGTIDENVLSAIENGTGGDLSPNALQNYLNNRSANKEILGIPVSTVILIAVAFLFWYQFKDDFKTSKKRR